MENSQVAPIPEQESLTLQQKLIKERNTEFDRAVAEEVITPLEKDAQMKHLNIVTALVGDVFNICKTAGIEITEEQKEDALLIAPIHDIGKVSDRHILNDTNITSSKETVQDQQKDILGKKKRKIATLHGETGASWLVGKLQAMGVSSTRAARLSLYMREHMDMPFMRDMRLNSIADQTVDPEYMYFSPQDAASTAVFCSDLMAATILAGSDTNDIEKRNAGCIDRYISEIYTWPDSPKRSMEEIFKLASSSAEWNIDRLTMGRKTYDEKLGLKNPDGTSPEHLPEDHVVRRIEKAVADHARIISLTKIEAFKTFMAENGYFVKMEEAAKQGREKENLNAVMDVYYQAVGEFRKKNPNLFNPKDHFTW